VNRQKPKPKKIRIMKNEIIIDRATARENYIADFCEKVIAIRTDWAVKSAHGQLHNWHCIDFARPTAEEAILGIAEVSEGEDVSPRKFFPESRWEVIESHKECREGYSPDQGVLMWESCPREGAEYYGDFNTQEWMVAADIESGEEELKEGWEFFKLGDFVDAPEVDYPLNKYTHDEISLEDFAGAAFDAIEEEKIDFTAVENARQRAEEALKNREKLTPEEIARDEAALRFVMAQLAQKNRRR
jgi:hypothetical protein